MDISSLNRIERLNYMLGGVLVIASALLASRAVALGVLVGVILSCANFTVMCRMVQRWMRTAPERRGPQSLLLLPKMSGLMLAVFLAVYFLPISGIGVLVGFSVFLVSIAVETVRYISNPPAGGAPGAGPSPGADSGTEA